MPSHPTEGSRATTGATSRSTSPRLLLFDIDGTLLRAHGLGRQTVEAALLASQERPISSEGVSFSGKTDPQIFREILRNTVDDDALDDALRSALEAYAYEVHRQIEDAEVEALTGARALLDALAAEQAPLGLVTGNLEAMAYLKLRRVGLDAFFPFGAFGSDAEERDALPPIALTRAKTHTGRAFAPDEAVVIGDTPLDIACGKAAGAVTVAVATGQYDRDALAAHAPDVLLDSFAETDRLLDLLL